MNEHNVVITGVGLLTSYGVGREPFVSALEEGKLALSNESRWSGIPERAALIQDFLFKDWVTTRNKRTKKMDMVSQYASVAALLALRDAGLLEDQGPLPPLIGEDFGIVTGSSFAAIESIALFHEQLATEGPDSVDPKVFPNTSNNVPCAHATIEFGLYGSMLNLCTGFHSGTAAMITAWRMLRRGRGKRLLVGGFDHVNSLVASALARRRYLAPDGETSQPYSTASQGGIVGEGAVFLVLETEEAARERKAKILARFLGGSIHSLPVGPCGIPGKEASWEQCIELGLQRASVKASDVSWTIGGGAGLPSLDSFEARGLASKLPGVPVFPLKGITGETLAAYGTMAAVTAVLSLDGTLGSPKVDENPEVIDGLTLGGPLRSGVVFVSDPSPGGSGGGFFLAPFEG